MCFTFAWCAYFESFCCAEISVDCCMDGVNGTSGTDESGLFREPWNFLNDGTGVWTFLNAGFGLPWNFFFFFLDDGAGVPWNFLNDGTGVPGICSFV